MSLKIVQVGCGYMAGAGHGPSLQLYASQHPEVELAACCDINLEAAQAFAQKFGFARAYTDMNEMLDKEQPGMVNLAVPVPLTAPMAIQVMRRGIPIILEKPPGANIDQAMQILEAGKNVPHRVAFNRRYVPLMLELKKRIEQVGQPISEIRCDFLRHGRYDDDFSSTAIHGIDAVQAIGGAYSEIDFMYREWPEKGKGVAHIHLQGRMASGAVATLSFMPISGCLAERYAVHTPGHSFYMNMAMGMDDDGCLAHWQDGKLVEMLHGRELVPGNEHFITNGFYNENAMFIDQLLKGEKVTGGMAEGALDPMRIADAIRARQSHIKL
nr:Gfo/Idh/MocA family oxidoreductase [bacterium]